MAPRTSLTVSELLDITSRAQDFIENAEGTFRAPAMKLLHDLDGLNIFLRDIIGSSGQGCAADAVILELSDEAHQDRTLPDAPPVPTYCVVYHDRTDGALTSLMVRATSPDEAMTIVERSGISYLDAEVRENDFNGPVLAAYGASGELLEGNHAC